MVFPAVVSCQDLRDKDKLKTVKLQEVAPFKIGVAIDNQLLQSNVKYQQIVGEEFNSITPENFLKMNRLQPAAGKYVWGAADSAIAYLIKNQKRIHGHTLVWHRALPGWLNNYNNKPASVDSLLKAYITLVVSHYKGTVTAWDVVNEAFENDGSFRHSIWFDALGEDYIKRAFLYAHEADPDALLFYNDFGQENQIAKCDAILKFVTKLKNEGVPIHGVGIQLHTNIFIDNSKIENALSKMAVTGLHVHISELTITVNPHRENNDFVQDTESNLRQMMKFAEIIGDYRKLVPKKQQYGITFWNVGDADSYFPRQCHCRDYPQIFDSSYEKKNFYYKVVAALESDAN